MDITIGGDDEIREEKVNLGEVVKNERQGSSDAASDEVEESLPKESTGKDADDAAAKISALEAAVLDKETRFLRLQADFENFRRRTRQEKDELADVVTQNILKDMLPLLDNLERALASEDGDGFRDGVVMIYKQFGEVLAKNGLEYIETDGKAFDPNFHQAVMRVQSEELDDGMIAGELQKGYIAKGRVIRPSMVQVVSN